MFACDSVAVSKVCKEMKIFIDEAHFHFDSVARNVAGAGLCLSDDIRHTKKSSTLVLWKYLLRKFLRNLSLGPASSWDQWLDGPLI